MLFCDVCQRKKFNKFEKFLHFILVTTLWQKIDLNCVHMFASKNKIEFVFARCDVSKWIKIKILRNFIARSITKFIFENIFCRHKLIDRFVMNNELKNKKMTTKLLNKYNVKITIISIYQFVVNEMIERDHQSMMNLLFKLTNDVNRNWSSHFHNVFWIDRTIIKAITNQSSHCIQYDQNAMFFIEMNFLT